MKNVQVEGNTRAKVQRDVEGCAALSRDLVRLSEAQDKRSRKLGIK